MSSGFLQSDQNGQIGNPRTIRVAYRENLRLLFARFVRSVLTWGSGDYYLSPSPGLVHGVD